MKSGVGIRFDMGAGNAKFNRVKHCFERGYARVLASLNLLHR